MNCEAEYCKYCGWYGRCDGDGECGAVCDCFTPVGICTDDLGLVELDGRWYPYEQADRMMLMLESEDDLIEII